MKRRKQPSLDETYQPGENHDTDLSPYDRLQSIFSEKDNLELSQTASEKLDFLLDEVKQPSLFDKFLESIKSGFNKVDNMIFRINSRKMNNQYYPRKK